MASMEEARRIRLGVRIHFPDELRYRRSCAGVLLAKH